MHRLSSRWWVGRWIDRHSAGRLFVSIFTISKARNVCGGCVLGGLLDAWGRDGPTGGWTSLH